VWLGSSSEGGFDIKGEEFYESWRRGSEVLFLCCGVFLFALVGPNLSAQSQPCQVSGKICILTWQQDTASETCAGCVYRTGENLSESIVTYNNIQFNHFQQRCSANLDGQIYAQPLVVAGATVGGVTPTNGVVYVVTQNDTLYAINGDPSANCAILGTYKFLPHLTGQTAASCKDLTTGDCKTINPSIGIMGTPVINISGNSGTIYLVTESEDSNQNFYHYLHALDIQSLTEATGSPIQIGTSNFSKDHIQRPALLYVSSSLATDLPHDYVFVAFSMMDGYSPPNFPNGAIFGYRADKLSDPVYSLLTSVGTGSGTSNGAGIWMGGAGPALAPDVNGKYWINLKTGNGSFNPNPSSGSPSWGDSFLKIDPYLLAVQNNGSTNTGYLTPVDQYFRSAWTQVNGQWTGACGTGSGDVDFGPAGVLVIPDSELVNWPQLTVSGDKEGGLWFIDRNIPGQFQNTCSSNPCMCTPSGNNPSGNLQTFWTGTAYRGQVIQGGLAYWENYPYPQGVSYIYAGLYNSTINRYALCGKSTDTLPLCNGNSVVSTTATFPTGATPTISAGSTDASDAIVWAIGGQVQDQSTLGTSDHNPGVLSAFDANTLAQLYSSCNSCTSDAINPSTKFSVPVPANGNVYVGTESDNVNNVGMGTFYIFGPKSIACQ
jgi:LysM repeat protein